jgi:4'-phosphopantetheinyl transferase EntD
MAKRDYSELSRTTLRVDKRNTDRLAVRELARQVLRDLDADDIAEILGLYDPTEEIADPKADVIA